MRKHRGILTALTLLTLAAAVAVLVGRVLFVPIHLPDPALCSQDELFRWLLMRDLRQQPRETNLALVNRLQQELHSDIEAEAEEAISSLSRVQRRRLRANVDLLKNLWFTSRVDSYHHCEASGRPAYLDKQLATIAAWSTLDEKMAANAPILPSGSARRSLQAKLCNQIDQWLASAQDGQRQRISEVVKMGLIRWLSTRNLNEEPPETRQELAKRIAIALNDGLRLNNILADSAPAEQTQLRANGELLMVTWLDQRAEEYFSLPNGQRAPFIDRQVEAVSRWDVLELLAPQQSNTTDDFVSIGTLARYATTMEQWIERLPTARQPPVRQLVTAMQQRWITRLMLPSAHSPK